MLSFQPQNVLILRFRLVQVGALGIYGVRVASRVAEGYVPETEIVSMEPLAKLAVTLAKNRSLKAALEGYFFLLSSI